MIRLAVIGTGRMGTYHTRLAAQHQGIMLAALVNPSTPSPELLAHAPHFTKHTDCIDLVDAAIIATPTPTHFAIAKDFLNAGKHVLVEKPITTSYQEAQELFSLATQQGVALHVGHVERYNAGLCAVQDQFKTPHLITTTRSGPFHPRVAGDSVVLDLMIHDIDLVMRIAGCAPSTIHALGSSSVSAQPDTAITSIALGSYTLANLVVHRGAAIGTRTLTVEQTSATFKVDFATQSATQYVPGGKPLIHSPEKTNALGLQLDYFVGAIKGIHPLSHAVHDLAVLETTLTIAAQVQAQLAHDHDTAAHSHTF